MRSRLVPCVVALVNVGWLAYLWWGHWDDANTAVWIASSVAVAGSVLGVVVPPRLARAHIAIAGVLMLWVAGYAATGVVGHWPFAWEALADPRYAAFITLMGVVVGIGLLCGAFWARWAALAFAVGSMLGGALNSINLGGARNETAWLPAIGVMGGLTVFTQLMRASVREHVAQSTKHALWTSRDRVIRSARWAAIANFAAAPMLLLYALGQPVAPETVVSALVLAPILGIGCALVVARRTAGVVILALGGVGLIAHSIASASYVAAMNLPIVGYYAAFWLPAAALGIIAGVLALLRARR
jgi:hypothetical protein